MTGSNPRLLGTLHAAAVAVTALFLLAPIFVTMVASVSTSTFAFPPRGLTLDWYAQAIGRSEFLRGALVSLVVGTVSSILANALALLGAFGIVRYQFPGKAVVNQFLMLPLLVPTVILGLALYIYMVQAGFGSGVVQLIVGHTLLVFPFATKVLTASVQTFDRALEEAAVNVGARPHQVLLYVTLPVLRTGLIAGVMMGFIISWNDFTMSLFLASPAWVPLPIEIYSYIKFQYDGVAAAVVGLVILFTSGLVFAASTLIGLRATMGRA